MNGQAVIYHPNGTIDIRPLRNTTPSLDFLRTAVDGDLELVPLFETILQGDKLVRCAAFCNEHGKNNGLPYNHPAQVLWKAAQAREAVEVDDYLVGKIIVITGDEELMESL